MVYAEEPFQYPQGRTTWATAKRDLKKLLTPRGAGVVAIVVSASYLFWLLDCWAQEPADSALGKTRGDWLINVLGIAVLSLVAAGCALAHFLHRKKGS